ncbi:hypothetical protein J3459_012456 [Metarhizium acridum]|nr:hypothetical protein J3459_012456 [Metarhizium acridum]
MLSLPGQLPARRYIALAIFFLLAVTLWQGFNPFHLAFKASSGRPIRYVPSTIDWSQAKIYFPAEQDGSAAVGKTQDLASGTSPSGLRDDHDVFENSEGGCAKGLHQELEYIQAVCVGQGRTDAALGKGQDYFFRMVRPAGRRSRLVMDFGLEG